MHLIIRCTIADINVLCAHCYSLDLDSKTFYLIRGHQGATINMRETYGTSARLGMLELLSKIRIEQSTKTRLAGAHFFLESRWQYFQGLTKTG